MRRMLELIIIIYIKVEFNFTKFGQSLKGMKKRIIRKNNSEVK